MSDAKRPMRAARVLWMRAVWLLAAILLAPPSTAAPAASSEVTLSQSSLTVDVDATTTLLVSASAAPKGSRLKLMADPGIVARVTERGQRHWIVSVGADPRLSEGLLTVQLLSRTNNSLGLAQAKVVAKPRPTVDAMVQANLVLDSDSLVEGRALEAFVTISNRSEQAVSIGLLRPIVPRGLQIDPGQAPGLLLPRKAIVKRLAIEATGEIAATAGKHVIGVVIPVSTDLAAPQAKVAGGARGRSGWSGEIVATKEVQLSVPGMSAVEGALQIPSLLLLPGLLVAITFSALLNLARPRPIGEDPLSRLSILLSPGLWVVMIMLSGAIGLAYSLLTGRNVLHAYSLRDVVWLWFGSILVGGAAGLCAFIREKKRQARATAPRFSPEIEPIVLLRQLQNEGETLRKPSKQAAGLQLFELGPGPDAGEVWACGRIDYRLVSQDPETVRKIRHAVGDADLGQVLSSADAGHIVLAWREYRDGQIRIAAPTLVSRDLFKQPLVEDMLVREAI